VEQLKALQAEQKSRAAELDSLQQQLAAAALDKNNAVRKHLEEVETLRFNYESATARVAKLQSVCPHPLLVPVCVFMCEALTVRCPALCCCLLFAVCCESRDQLRAQKEEFDKRSKTTPVIGIFGGTAKIPVADFKVSGPDRFHCPLRVLSLWLCGVALCVYV
jgi:hypothetical protein